MPDMRSAKTLSPGGFLSREHGLVVLQLSRLSICQSVRQSVCQAFSLPVCRAKASYLFINGKTKAASHVHAINM